MSQHSFKLRVRSFTLGFGLVVCSFTAPGQAQTGSAPAPSFEKIEAMVPMRDGVRLHTAVYVPRSAPEPLPFMLSRTPYGARFPSNVSRSPLKELAEEGYIFVLQDIRGRFTSEGKFVMLRPPRDRSDPKAIDESTDTYDTIEWLLKMVQVQSTWFPVIDRNPQKFVDNIFKARESDFQPATQRVFHSRRFPSHVTLPVLGP